jgi:N-acetylglucosamine-6-phosphate deacetylase
LASEIITGRIAGSPAVVQIRYGAVIENVDELITPPQDTDLLAPGFIDLQVNGFAGTDYNDPASSQESIARSIEAAFRTGVTRLYPTMITGSEERITAALRNMVAAKHEFSRSGMPHAHAMAGFHIEGPHISPEDGPRGAHPLEHVRPPDKEEFKRWQEAADGDIRVVTISPEWDGVPAYITELLRHGVVASIGHTKATAEQMRAAVDAGATMSTHLGNAAHPYLPKTQNYIWEQLAEDRLTAGFITDGIHIPSAFFRAAVQAKGPERSVLVTDAVAPAMCGPGEYRLGEIDVELKPDGSVVMRATSRLAGSALRMDRGIGNAVRMGRITLREAISMATTNPARAGRIAGRQRGLVPGEKADFVRYGWNAADFSLKVLETVVNGETVYNG